MDLANDKLCLTNLINFCNETQILDKRIAVYTDSVWRREGLEET